MFGFVYQLTSLYGNVSNMRPSSTEREPRAEAVSAGPPPPGVPVRVGGGLRQERARAAGLAHLDHADQRRRPRDAQGQDAQPGRAANGASQQSTIRWVSYLTHGPNSYPLSATDCPIVNGEKLCSSHYFSV